MKVKIWQMKHRKYKIELPYENDQFLVSSTSFLGMQFGWNQNNIIMEGFYNNFRTGKFIYTYVCCTHYCVFVWTYYYLTVQMIPTIYFTLCMYVCMYVQMHIYREDVSISAMRSYKSWRPLGRRRRYECEERGHQRVDFSAAPKYEQPQMVIYDFGTQRHLYSYYLKSRFTLMYLYRAMRIVTKRSLKSVSASHHLTSWTCTLAVYIAISSIWWLIKMSDWWKNSSPWARWLDYGVRPAMRSLPPPPCRIFHDITRLPMINMVLT